MAGEIDSLEIKISAEADSAKKHILELSEAMWDLQNSAQPAGKGMRSVANSLSRINKSFSGDEGLEKALSDLENSVERINGIKVGGGFDDVMHLLNELRSAATNISAFKIDKDFTDGISRIAKAAEVLNDVDFSGMREMQDVLAQMPENVNVSFGASTDEVQELINSLTMLRGQIYDIGNSVESIKIETEKTPKRINNTKSKPIPKKSDEEMSRVQQVLQGSTQEIIEQADAWSRDYKEIKRAIDAYAKIGETIPPELRRIAEEYGVIERETSKFKQSMSAAGKNIKSSFASIKNADIGKPFKKLSEWNTPIKKLGDSLKGATTKIGQFFNSVKRVAMYRAIRSALKSITEGLEEGRKNLYFYSKEAGTEFAKSMDKAATAFLYLKNSIGAATAPLTNYFVPILDRIIDKVVELLNRFNEMTAALTGASTWTKAIKYPTQWQEATDEATKSAKKLKSVMLGFDELNVIEQDDKGIGAKLNTDLDYSKMFQEVQTSIDASGLDILLPIKLALDEEGANTINSIKSAWESIKNLVEAVGKSFKEVWENGTGQKSLELVLQTIQNIFGTIENIADGIRKAWEENETGTEIIQHIWNGFNNILTVVRDIWASIKSWTENLDWTPLLSALNYLSAAWEKITDPNSTISKTVTAFFEEVLLPIGTWLIEEGLPVTASLLANILTTCEKIAEVIHLDELLAFFGELATLTFSNISGLAASLDIILSEINGEEMSDSSVNALEKSADRIKHTLSSAFGDEFGQDWSKFWEGFGTGEWTEWFSIGMNNPVMKFFEGFGQFATDCVNGIISALESLGQFATDVVTGVFGTLEKLGQTVTDVIVGIWDTFATIGQGVTDFLVGIYEHIKNDLQLVSELFNDMVETVCNVWEIIKESAQNFWDWLKGLFTNKADLKKMTGGAVSIKNAFGDNFDKIKDKAEEIWNAVKDFFSNRWTDVKNSFTDFKDHARDKFDEVKNNALNAWNGIKNNLTDAISWQSIKGKITEYQSDWQSGLETIKSDAGTKIIEIKDKLIDGTVWQSVWDFLKEIPKKFEEQFDEAFKKAKDFVTKIVKKISHIWDDEMGGGIKGFINSMFVGAQNALSRVGDIVKAPYNAIVFNLNQGIQAITNGLNSFLSALNIDFTLPAALGSTHVHFDAPVIPTIQIPPMYDKGGFPESGQLFIANEYRPELVGTIGNHTAVANNDQIVAAVSRGVAMAVERVIQNNRSESNGEYKFYLDGKPIAAYVEKYQQESGMKLFDRAIPI